MNADAGQDIKEMVSTAHVSDQGEEENAHAIVKQ